MRPATEVFSEWAEKGKDLGMESGHAPAVGEILKVAIAELDCDRFDAIDSLVNRLNTPKTPAPNSSYFCFFSHSSTVHLIVFHPIFNF